MGERWEMLPQGSQLPLSTQKPPAEEEGGTSSLSAAPASEESGFRWPEEEMFLCEEDFELVRSVINASLVGWGQKSMGNGSVAPWGIAVVAQGGGEKCRQQGFPKST